MPKIKSENCELCERKVPKLTKHHLVPRSYGGEKTIDVCNLCHSQIHALFSNWELKEFYNTKEALKESQEFSKFLAWARKQKPNRKIKVKSKKY